MSELTEHPVSAAGAISSPGTDAGGAGGQQSNYLNLRRFTLTKYGLTPDDYQTLWQAQDGRCAICRRKETAMREGTPKMLAVDHDAVTGRVRGLLCFACNVALGFFSDNTESLRAAIAYLDRPSPVPAGQQAFNRLFERVPFIHRPVAGEVR